MNILNTLILFFNSILKLIISQVSLKTKTKSNNQYISTLSSETTNTKYTPYINNNLPRFNINIDVYVNFTRFLLKIIPNLRYIYLFGFGVGFYYLQGLVFVLFVDACLTDDEPL